MCEWNCPDCPKCVRKCPRYPVKRKLLYIAKETNQEYQSKEQKYE